MKKTSISFSGHRQSKLPKKEDSMIALNELLEREIICSIEHGFNTFYTGLCNGFDLLSAKKVIALNTPSIKLIGVVPYRGQESEWSVEEQEEYQLISEKCSKLIILNETKVKGCYYQRNRYMVDHSAKLICYCSRKQGGTAYTLTYAEKENLSIVNLYKK